MSQIRNVFHEKIIQFLVVFILWHFESFLLSVVVTTIGIGEASIAVVAKAVVAVVRISRRLGSGGSLGGPLAVDNSTIGIGVASIAVMAEAVDTVVRLRLGSGSGLSRPLAIVVTAIGIREAGVAVVAETIVAIVGISRGSRGSFSLSRPLAVVVATIGIGVASIAIMAKAVEAVVGLRLGIGIRGAHGQGDHGENNQSLDHAAASAEFGLKCNEFLGG